MNYRKIIQSVALARRANQASGLQFQVLTENGFYITFDGNKILEFDTLLEAQSTQLILVNAVSSHLASYVKTCESKIDTILNA